MHPSGFREVRVFTSVELEGLNPLEDAVRIGATVGNKKRLVIQEQAVAAGLKVLVSMGGYNTLCEILSQGTISLVIPRETPRKEQLIRAQTFQRQNLIDFIAWDQLTPDLLHARLTELLSNPDVYRDAIAAFALTGLETMKQRLQDFRCHKP